MDRRKERRNKIRGRRRNEGRPATGTRKDGFYLLRLYLVATENRLSHHAHKVRPRSGPSESHFIPNDIARSTKPS
jgi:hypothetical protein